MLLSSHTHFEHSNLAKKLWDKDWFMHIISRIWVFLLYLRLLFKELRWCHKACHHTTSLCIIPIEKPLIKQVIVLVKKNPLQHFCCKEFAIFLPYMVIYYINLKTKTLNPYTIDCLRICKQQSCLPSSSHSRRYRLPERLRLLARRHSYGLSCSLPEYHQHGERLPCQL